MKKYLTTLLVVASTAIHAQAADLVSQLPGYWQPDMAKTLALAKKANREIDPITELMLGKMVFEFHKDKLIMHGPPGNDIPPVPYTVKGVDKAANSLTIVVEGEEQKARFHEGQLALNDPNNGWIIFNRMSKEEFAKRPIAAAKAEGEEEG